MLTINNQTVGALRDQSAELLGKRVTIDNLTLPAEGGTEEVQLSTRGSVAAVISKVEVYPYLQEGTFYKSRFDDHPPNKGRIFTFPVRGNPGVSVALTEDSDAIAVVKRLITHQGEEVPWSALLERLGADPSQFKHFNELVYNVHPTGNASLRFTKVPGFDVREVVLHEHPIPDVPNLDSVLSLSRDGRERLRTLLSSLLRSERAEG